MNHIQFGRPGGSSSAPRGLHEAVQREKLFGLSTSISARDQALRPFRGKYLLVTEFSQQYQPVYAKEFKENEKLPKIHMTGAVPFALMSDSDGMDEEENVEDAVYTWVIVHLQDLFTFSKP
jgi:hypothetical protein